MARSFHRKKQLEAVSELNVTALIDLGFALLIIFMISTPLIEVEQIMEVDLPVASSSSNETPTNPVNIVVMPDGSYRVDGSQMGDVELEQELKRFSEMRDQPVMSIRADAATPWQNVVTLMDLLKQYKLKKLDIITRPEG